MNYEEHLSFPKYNFNYNEAESEGLIYSFETKAKVVYLAAFKPSGYIFPSQS